MKAEKDRKEKTKFGRYFVRLWANSIFLVALPILVLGYVSYGVAAGLLQEKVGDIYLHSLQHAAEKLDQRLHGIKMGLYQASESIYIQILQRSHPPFSPALLLDVESFIEELHKLKTFDDLILETFTYFTLSDTIIDSIMKYDATEYFSRRMIFPGHEKGDYRGLLGNPTPMKFFLPGRLKYNDANGIISQLNPLTIDESVMLIRSLPLGVQPPSTVCGALLDLEAMKAMLLREGLLIDLDICIMNDDGTVIVETKDIQDSADDLFGGIFAVIGDSGDETGSRIMESGGRTYAVLYSRLRSAGWNLVALVETSIITREALRLRYLALGISALILVIGAIVAFFAARKLYRPVNQMIARIEGHQPDKSSRHRLDELGIISEQLVAAEAVRERYRLSMQRYLPVVRERFFYHLAKGNYQSTIRIRQQLDELEIRLDPGFLYACSLEIDHFLAMMDSEKHIQRQYLLVVITEHIVGKLQAVFTDSYIFYDEHRIGIMVCCNSDGPGMALDLLIRIFQEIQGMVAKEKQLTVSVGISRSREAIEDFADAYDEAVEAVGMKFFLGLNQVISHQEYELRNTNLHTLSAEDQEHIVNYILNGSISDAAGYIDSIVSHRLEAGDASPKMVRDFYTHVLWLVLDTLDSTCRREAHIKVLNRDKIRRIDVIETFEETRRYVAELFESLISASRDSLERYDGRVRRIVSFMEEHYRRDLTLTTVAEQFSLSPAYLSSLFKKATGETFTDYLTALRIERAKERIRINCSLKIAAIAAEVGFGSYKSFARAFKHHVGLSPGDFRRQAV